MERHVMGKASRQGMPRVDGNSGRGEMQDNMVEAYVEISLQLPRDRFGRPYELPLAPGHDALRARPLFHSREDSLPRLVARRMCPVGGVRRVMVDLRLHEPRLVPAGLRDRLLVRVLDNSVDHEWGHDGRDRP